MARCRRVGQERGQGILTLFMATGYHVALTLFTLLTTCFAGARANRALETRSLLETEYSLSKGPYGVTNTNTSEPHRALVFAPYLLETHSDEEEETQKFPAIIFAHG
eukprot:CAMPEP_0198235076 /NCGR_PEP_ID=MMETSP1446-20131203/970_1 /TAXON_ID=1461542 ORGANISM="Unidentified sp, Strain CCMP2111" /NCGR_SAMPLE_ID=MMETSP1446 /ASSEMBLY_ACC=CAM_ASM_001112 /LENGTH=106 /DNA_ID=CAMNT_0043916049 /DNA_START=28 /DNA_END=345 /DNA_ORIENTATION=-